MARNSAVVVRKAAVPSFRLSPSPIRREADRGANAVSGFCHAYPEYSRLAPDVVEQVMATYRTDEEHEMRRLLGNEGVALGRGGVWSDDA